MKFTLNRSNTLPLLSQALRTCNLKNKGEVDSMFLFELLNGKINLTSADKNAEQIMTLSVLDIDDSGESSFTVDGTSIVEFLRQFPDEEILCSYNTDKSAFIMSSKTRHSKFAFLTGKAKDFMKMSFTDNNNIIKVKGSALSAAFKKSAFSTSLDTSLSPLTSIRLQIKADKILTESSDNYRITTYNIINEGVENTLDLLIPKETADNLSVILDSVEEVSIIPSKRLVRFTWDNTVYTSRLENSVGKPFPQVSKFLGGDKKAFMTLSRGDLLRSLKLASLVAKDSYLNLSVQPNGLLIATDEKDKGASQDLVTAQSVEGEAESLIACKYLIKGIEMTDSPWITLEFRNVAMLEEAGCALVIVDGNFEHFIFPVAPNDLDIEDEEDTTPADDGGDE